MKSRKWVGSNNGVYVSNSPVSGVSGLTFHPLNRIVNKVCPKCEHDKAEFELLKSSCGGFEDDKYICTKCRYTWYIDGPDS